MAITYWTVATTTFCAVLAAFVKDTSASKFDADAWLFIAIATLLWPVTLPTILNRKLRSRQRTEAPKSAAESSSFEYLAARYSSETPPTAGQPLAIRSTIYTPSTCDL